MVVADAPRRRPGRPPKENVGERVHMDIIVTPELRRRVRIAAAEADMGASEWLRQAAEEKLERDGR